MNVNPSGYTWQIPLALGALYLIWGSTYLGMKIATETIPPYLMAGTRFTFAGMVLFGITRWHTGIRPTRVHWRSALIVGGALLLGGNATVAWSVGRLPSGVASLMIATMPMWMVLLDWLWHGATRPTMQIVMGLLLGFVGIGFLMIQGGSELSAENLDTFALTALLVASIIWAGGSLYSRNAPQASAPFMNIGMQNICGGLMVFLVGLLRGEWAMLHMETISSASISAWWYLVVFGSMIGFSCYIWLLRVAPSAKVATYAYVNPVVAVLLGWFFNNEPLGSQTMFASIFIIAAVMLILRRPKKDKTLVTGSTESSRPFISDT